MSTPNNSAKFTASSERPITPYIILSPTWGHNEVIYNEMMTLTPDTLKKEGYLKVQYFARTVALWTSARRDSVTHV